MNIMKCIIHSFINLYSYKFVFWNNIVVTVRSWLQNKGLRLIWVVASTQRLVCSVKTPYLPLAVLWSLFLHINILLFAIFQGLYLSFDMLYQDGNWLFSLCRFHIIFLCYLSFFIYINIYIFLPLNFLQYTYSASQGRLE